jgi:hypothetical protein
MGAVLPLLQGESDEPFIPISGRLDVYDLWVQNSLFRFASAIFRNRPGSVTVLGILFLPGVRPTQSP